jgi:hypothetical protein
MSSLTAVGKPRKSRFEGPTQCSGFSSAARTRRTYMIIPVLGYPKQMMSPPAGVIQSHFESVIGRNLRRPRSRAIMLGLVAVQSAPLQLDATAEETMSPIARRPMPSSLLAAA